MLAEVRPEDEAVSVIEVEAEGEELREEVLAPVGAGHAAPLVEALGVGDRADNMLHRGVGSLLCWRVLCRLEGMCSVVNWIAQLDMKSSTTEDSGPVDKY